jgi:hypothetical protein
VLPVTDIRCKISAAKLCKNYPVLIRVHKWLYFNRWVRRENPEKSKACSLEDTETILRVRGESTRLQYRVYTKHGYAKLRQINEKTAIGCSNIPRNHEVIEDFYSLSVRTYLSRTYYRLVAFKFNILNNQCRRLWIVSTTSSE